MAAVALAVAVSPSGADLARAANENTTFVLHAVAGSVANDCSSPQQAGFDCEGVPAVVNVAAGVDVDVYLYMRNHDEVASLQCAFTWPAAWTYHGWSGGCLAGQMEATVPTQPGPVTGTLIATFDCVTSGMLEPIGFLGFTAGDSGCLEIIDSAPPGMTGVGSCTGAPAAVPPVHRGTVCVGGGGADVCVPAPVSAATWGRIKSAYRR